MKASLTKLWIGLVSMTVIMACTEVAPYKNAKLDIELRVADLLKRMTLDEKIDQLAGLKDSTGMNTVFNERLGIPEFKMSDGPVGVRWKNATAFPSGVSLAATFDTTLARLYGKQLAIETRAKGRNVILGPCINIHRLPIGGRNFESFGEDPFLASRMAVAYVKAVQAEQIIPSVKHYALNNQEWRRTELNVLADERTMREIYLPAFEAAVKEGGAYTLMASYNKINGSYASENKHLLNDILKKEWGFKGLVVSDWGATHSTVAAVNNGLDLEMPNGAFLNRTAIKQAIQEGKLTEAAIDNMVQRILWVKFKAGLFDNNFQIDSTLVGGEKSRKLAYDVAARSIVLLKNDANILPLDFSALKSIAIIGPNAGIARTGGGGSSHVSPTHSISPLEAIQKLAGSKLKVNYAEGVQINASSLQAIESNYFETPDGEPGLKAEYFIGKDLTGQPKVTRIEQQINNIWDDKAPVAGLTSNNYSVRWTGQIEIPENGNCTFYTASDDGIRLYLNGKLVINNWSDHGTSLDSCSLNLKKGQKVALKLEFYENGGSAVCQLGWNHRGSSNHQKQSIEEAVQAAKQSDVALVFVGSTDFIESEGYDRVGGLSLGKEQDELVAAIVKANPKTIVVLNTGTPVLMGRWQADAKAILETFFAGQEGALALADILTGKVNPSGKLPFSFIAEAKQSPAFNGYTDKSLSAPYAEGVFVGYRYIDKHGMQPAYPFGFGLSYTSFALLDIATEPLKNDSIKVVVRLKNTGKRAGYETVQLYVSAENPQVERPIKELKGFGSILLQPNETASVTMILSKRSFARYDINLHDWVVDKGNYRLLAGNSSTNISLETMVTIQ
jgi:beta-glucosidase